MRELYASPNGDRWWLMIDPPTGRAFVRHEANAPSGGNVHDRPLAAFLNLDVGAPEHRAFWELLRPLVEGG